MATKAENLKPVERAPFQGSHGIVRLINRVRVEIVDALDRELAKYDITAPIRSACCC
jgi:hypothetical protein